jgi:hypothetical protein
MKSVGFASILVLSLTIPQLATAQTASGTYRFLLEDELIKSVELAADERGGYLTFTDEAKVLDGDDIEDPRRGDATPIYIKADFDGLTVEKNRALMSGFIVDSSHTSYIGTLVQLVVEDNVENSRIPDTLTWAFCKPRELGWVPSDAELKDDDGAYLRWWATDAERDDDVGIPSVNLLSNESDCPVFPVWSYSMADIWKWEGDIIVKP